METEGSGEAISHRLQQLLVSIPKKSHAAVRDIEVLSQKRGKNLAEERFKVTPDYAYPNARFTRDELRREMNAPSEYYHDLAAIAETNVSLSEPDTNNNNPMIGKISLEILQCFGIPKEGVLGESSDFCIAVCGKYAFKTDVMPRVANPIWLSKMRRACILPIYEAYARLYVGVFGQSTNDRKDGFAGRIVLDVARLRPGSLYDVTLPLRQSSHVYSREQRGAIRIRFHLHWYSERQAILSYLPKKVSQLKPQPNESCTISCCDVKSFQNVARTVHGDNFPGRFTLQQFKATLREINFTRIHVLRYIRKREFHHLRRWDYPLMSGFVFVAWMHCVYDGSLSHAPGHLVTYLLLHLWKNYAYYAMDSPVQNGFLAPTWEELFAALCFGGRTREGQEQQRHIEPLAMEPKDKSQKCWDDMVKSDRPDPSEEEDPSASLSFRGIDILKVANAFRRGFKTRTLRHAFRVYHRAFRGNDAVNFLIKSGYARSRDTAVVLGQRFATELKLFEHVTHRQKDFQDDENQYYHFLECDLREYVTKTHRPRGKLLFASLGLLPNMELHESDVHLEMPYSTGVDHPRFTVKDSLVIRSKESRRILLNEQQQGTIHSDETSSDHLSRHFDSVLDNDFSNIEEEEEQEEASAVMDVQDSYPHEEEYIENGVVTNIRFLKKAPPQELNVKAKGNRKLPDVLAQARHKVHGVLLHLFNDRVYPSTKVPDPLDPAADEHSVDSPSSKLGNVSIQGSSPATIKSGRSESSSSRRRRRILPLNHSPGSKNGVRSSPAKNSTAENQYSTNDNYDRLLHSGKYSNGNPLISKVGVIAQPIIEILLAFLCLFRSLFNIFTWRDPILSFWVSLLGPVLVLVLHFIPWRIILGVVGVVLFGPQNLIFRLVWEHGKDAEDLEFDPDKVVKKRKVKDAEPDIEEDPPLFSNFTPNNNPITNADIDDSEVRQVVVPNSPLMYQRFYDWPPENQYAFVTASDAPQPILATSEARADVEANESFRSTASARRGLRLRNRRRSRSPAGHRVMHFFANRRQHRQQKSSE